MSDTPNNTIEMMHTASVAAMTGDEATLLLCQEINNNWLQTEEERAAMEHVLQTLLELCE